MLSPAVASTVSGVPRVVDGDTLVVENTRVRLFGIDAPESKQTCQRASGGAWSCGVAATQSLRELAKQGVRCSGDEEDRYGRLIAVCHAGGRDVNAAMVARGAAFAYRKYSMAYVRQEAEAKSARRGVWQGSAERPDLVRAQKRASSAAPPPQAGCAIKGNISMRGHLYHLRGMRSYAATRINTRKGERWFCSETQAKAAGWRRAGG
ncbi:thermonuclease family protein [Thioclava sp.]|uniref:thermonuclease family protein n=1 Tax=Thioclava sp. TaxID=1933450 RepID=UPI003AA91882